VVGKNFDGVVISMFWQGKIWQMLVTWEKLANHLLLTH